MTREEFRKAIAQLESSNGRNTNHPMVNHGVNKGTKAIGTYALMPATVDELTKKKSDLAFLASMSPEQKTRYLIQHPETQDILFNQMYDHLDSRYRGNPRMMAEAYNAGMYLPVAKMTPSRLESSDYVNKFDKLTNKLSGNNIAQANIMPETQKIVKNTPQNLPTNDVASLESIINDPNNPFNQPDEMEDELLKKQGMLGYL